MACGHFFTHDQTRKHARVRNDTQLQSIPQISFPTLKKPIALMMKT